MSTVTTQTCHEGGTAARLRPIITCEQPNGLLEHLRPQVDHEVHDPEHGHEDPDED